MTHWRKKIRILVATALLSGLAQAAPVTTNFSDLWWNANESGWGVNVSQQGDFLFLTFFVYGTGGVPAWYTAQLSYSSQGANGSLVFTGDVYATAGPWFGGAFNPNAVTVRKVGSATFTGTGISTATLTYSVDGVVVTKSVTRQTLKTESIAGTYLGGTYSVASCSNPAYNGPSADAATITITQSGSNFQMRTADLDGSGACTFSGTYAQNGQMASVSGSYSCTSGETGSFQVFELQSSISGFMGRYSAVGTYLGVTCNVSGRLAAVKTN